MRRHTYDAPLTDRQDKEHTTTTMPNLLIDSSIKRQLK